MNNKYLARQEMVLKPETSNKLDKVKILIVGLGAGGNEAAKDMILQGFSNLTLVDFDHIEDSNLSRTTLFRKEHIGEPKALVAEQELNKMCLQENKNIKGYNAKIQDLGAGIIENHDIIVSCVDSQSARAHLNDYCVMLKKPFFEMGFKNFDVVVTFFYQESKDSPCLREWMGNMNETERRNSCSGLKMKDNNFEHIPTIQSAAALAGVLLSSEIINYLEGESKLMNKVLHYNLKHHQKNIFTPKRSKSCHIHSKANLPLIDSSLTFNSTVGDFLNKINKEHDNQFMMKLRDEFILGFNCYSCNKRSVLGKFRSEIYHDDVRCDNCTKSNLKEENYPTNLELIGELFLKNVTHKKYLQMRLNEIGFKDGDLVHLEGLNPHKEILVKLKSSEL